MFKTKNLPKDSCRFKKQILHNGLANICLLIITPINPVKARKLKVQHYLVTETFCTTLFVTQTFFDDKTNKGRQISYTAVFAD